MSLLLSLVLSISGIVPSPDIERFREVAAQIGLTLSGSQILEQFEGRYTVDDPAISLVLDGTGRFRTAIDRRVRQAVDGNWDFNPSKKALSDQELIARARGLFSSTVDLDEFSEVIVVHPTRDSKKGVLKGRTSITVRFQPRKALELGGFGDCLNVTLDHQSGEFVLASAEYDFTYEDATDLISMSQAKARFKELLGADPTSNPVLRYYPSSKKVLAPAYIHRTKANEVIAIHAKSREVIYRVKFRAPG